ncbi:hypothetical protein FRC07_010290, partial [Ceratobasidium sp. 392]
SQRRQGYFNAAAILGLFTICRLAPANYSHGYFQPSESDSLDVYIFGTNVSTPVQAVHAASFIFPSKGSYSRYGSAYSTFTLGYDGSAAKVYDLEPQDRLVYISISLAGPSCFAAPDPLCSLWISVSALLSALLKPGSYELDGLARPSIPWAGWADKASWILWGDSNVSPDVYTFGQRCVSLANTTQNLTLFDFYKRRMTSWAADTHNIDSLMCNQKRAKQVVSCTRVARAAEEYPKAVYDPRRMRGYKLADIGGEHGYLLELDACGYIEPNCRRTDLSYAEMIELLQDHKTRWDNPQNVVPTYYELLPGTMFMNSRPFTKGTLTTASKRLNRFVQEFRFYQLPSKNRGTEFRHWCIDLGVLLWDFLVDPDEDLLVGLEAVTTPTPASKVHLRSMKTGEDHPKVVSSQFMTAHQALDQFDFSSVEMIGHSLALFGWSWLDGDFHVEVWDWTMGQQLSYLDLSNVDIDSPRLLSEGSFVVCQSASFDTRPHSPEDEFGWLKVYQFGLRVAIPAEAVHVASFVLPLESKANLAFHSVPSASTPSHSYFSSKVYDLNSRDGFIHVSISTRSNKSHLEGNLCTPVSTLLDALPEPGALELGHSVCASILWADWAPKAFWILWNDSKAGMDVRFIGQRSASLGADEQSLVILDLRKRRMTTWDISAHDIPSLMRSQERAKNASSCVKDAKATGEYPKAVWDPRRIRWSWAYMDDEHVIVLNGSPSQDD